MSRTTTLKIKFVLGERNHFTGILLLEIVFDIRQVKSLFTTDILSLTDLLVCGDRIYMAFLLSIVLLLFSSKRGCL